MLQKSTFELVREKYKQAQTERNKELEKARKKLADSDEDLESELEPPPHEKTQQTVKEAKKTIELRENLRNLLKQTQVAEIVDKEDKEKQFKPKTQMLQKVEKAVMQTDEDLSKKLELLPKFKPKRLGYDSEEPKPLPEDEDVEEKSIKAILDKGTGVISKGFGALPRKYLHFPDDKFGIWYDEEKFYIGDKSNEILIDGNDLIVSGEKYKGTHGLWRLLTNPNKKNLDQETYDTW